MPEVDGSPEGVNAFCGSYMGMLWDLQARVSEQWVTDLISRGTQGILV